MRKMFFLLGVFALIIAFVSCEDLYDLETEEYNDENDGPDLKVAVIGYDSFYDSLDWSFTDIPVIPLKPGARTVCGYDSNNRWGRVSWNWPACPLYPSLATTSGGYLQLQVPGNRQKKGAQIETIRDDYSYGSYRAKIKAGAHSGTHKGKKAPGTCNSFFFYNSATEQEIDIEILAKEHESKKVRFATHPGTWSYAYTLPIDPTTEFIEYGFDWYVNRIDFFVNGVKVTVKGKPVAPTVKGKIMLNHWTGNPNWSGIAPVAVSNMLVDYIKHVPFLQLSFPDASVESLSRAEAHTIKWEKWGDASSYPVNIELWKNGAFNQMVADRARNTGSFVWNIPACVIDGEGYQLKIKSTLNSNYFDFGKKIFSIR